MAPIINVSQRNFDRATSVLEKAGIPYSFQRGEQVADLDRSSWIVIPYEFTDGRYSLEVSPGRLAHNPTVEKVGRELGLRFANTARDSLGREFVGNNNWFEFLKLNSALGVETPTLKQFNDFSRLLYQGMRGQIKVCDVSGKKLTQEYLKQIFEDIYEAKSPWRAEWLDADFKIQGKKLIVNYHVFENGKIVQKSEVLDKDTLMEDRTPGVSLEGWLKSPTSQGLPTKKTKSGDLFYWCPKSDNNSVARFAADDGWADLVCDWVPLSSNASLGVRPCRKA